MNAYTLTANKGEWSELYVLFKLFSENKIKAADMNLQPTDDEYTFLKVFREDVDNRPYVYDLEQMAWCVFWQKMDNWSTP